MRVLVAAPPPLTFKVFKASLVEFPALNGQSVSYAVLLFPSGSINPVHTHPRSANLLFLFEGSLKVGFVDTTNSSSLKHFSLGLVHFQYNADAKVPALAISTFGSSNAGTVSLPNTPFNTSIDDNDWPFLSKLMLPPFRSSRQALHPRTRILKSPLLKL
ncbi:germin 9-3 [Olea europaea subsp. europaea]|uniref:Germin 9-3 n=1 Tax=Olea europaea subsp. europaea TaxID=158383 RepID=A0A8S0PGZ2_OLEEU|nr:germin 9-3 [Olea europaea subsp. europaea]